MKIKPEHYEQLKTAIQNVVAWYGRSAILQYKDNLSKDPVVKDAKVRFHWDLFWAIEKINRERWIKEVYAYAADSHIQTALFKVGKELQLY